MNRSFSVLLIAILFVAASCNTGVKPDQLRGKWKYIKVFKPEASPSDSVSNIELEEKKPYIEFTGNDKLQIIWGGEVLSHGTYRVDGNNIHFKEVFANGQTREFPFYVSKLTEKELIFETVGEDGSRVTAVRE